jgi:hypothetical protein
VAVRLQPSDAGGAAGGEALTAEGRGRVRRAASRAGQADVERPLAEPGAAADRGPPW